MHELGIVFYIIKDVKPVAEQNNATHVHSVTLNLGEVSGVVPELLQDCWKWAVKKESLMTDCELVINTLPAVTYCEDCQKEYSTIAHGKTCPHCGSVHTYLKTGNEVEIKDISIV